MRKIVFLIILLSLNLSFCYAQEDKEAAQEVDRFTLVQYKDGGEKRWTLNGKSAEVKGDKVRIDEISVVSFGEKTSLKLKAKNGDFDREENLVHLENNVVIKATDGTTLTTDSLDWDAETKNIFSEELVKIKKADFEVEGLGAICDLEAKTAELKKDVTANVKSPDSGILRTTNDPSTSLRAGERRTTITCDGPLEINYKKNKATFQNNVRIEDVQGDIFADRIDVYFSRDTRRIKCAVARGNVKIVTGENVTYSERAIYLVDRGRVVLPKRPKLVIKNDSYK